MRRSRTQLSSGLEALASSEYAETFIAPPIDAYSPGERFKNKRPKTPEPAAPEKTSYESTYDVMTGGARGGWRGPVSSRHRLPKRRSRTNKRRMSIAVQEAAAKAQLKSEERAAPQPRWTHMQRRFSVAAAEAAAVAATTITATALANTLILHHRRVFRSAMLAAGPHQPGAQSTTIVPDTILPEITGESS